MQNVEHRFFIIKILMQDADYELKADPPALEVCFSKTQLHALLPALHLASLANLKWKKGKSSRLRPKSLVYYYFSHFSMLKKTYTLFLNHFFFCQIQGTYKLRSRNKFSFLQFFHCTVFWRHFLIIALYNDFFVCIGRKFMQFQTAIG